MISDHLSFVYDCTYNLHESGVLSGKDKAAVVDHLNKAGALLDKAEMAARENS